MNRKKDYRINKPIKFENKIVSVYYYIPLLLIAGFIPLIVYAKFIDLSGTTQALYWTGQQQYLDFFSYWKSKWIMILTAISLIIYIVLYSEKKLPFKNLKQYYIPLGIYALFVILSTIFSADKSTALWGFIDMYQGMFVLLSYVSLTFLAINFVNNERDVTLFMKAFLFLIIAEGIIGITQYFGFDFFQTKIGSTLILPAKLRGNDLSFSFGPKTIYGTLFNTNFVGSFATLMLPLSVAFLMGAKDKKQRLISGIAVVLMIFLWIGCNSRAGYLGIGVSFIFALILFRKLVIKHWKVSIGLFAVLAALLFVLNSTSGGAIFNRIKTLNIVKQLEEMKVQDEDTLKFEDIVLGKDSFSIKTNKETLNFRLDEDKLFFLDENNNELSITKDSNKITINDERYSRYLITIADKYPGVSVNAHGKLINFYIAQDGIKIIGSGGRLTEPKASQFFGPLRGLETLGSNRGYEWGTTIPMLKDYALVGSGPDNFPIVYNQDDFIGKLNLINFDANIVVDKPHNMYLQTGINTGVISLISFLALMLIYLFTGFKLYIKATFSTLEEKVGSACLLAIIGYLAAGLFNDNITSVSPLFWMILGIGISVNLMVKSRVNLNE